MFNLIPVSSLVDSDVAIAYDPTGDRMLVAGMTSMRATRDPWVAIQAHHRPRNAASIRWVGDGCPSIGRSYIPGTPRSRRPPLIGFAPYAGQELFELHLEGAPPEHSVSLVISTDLWEEAETEPCKAWLDRTEGRFAIFDMMTDERGRAVKRVSLDDFDLNGIFPTDTTAFRERGEILNFPRRLYAKWVWHIAREGTLDVSGLHRYLRRTVTPAAVSWDEPFGSDIMILLLTV